MDRLMEQAGFHTGWGGTINTQVTQCEVHWGSGGRIPQEILWKFRSWGCFWGPQLHVL